MNRMYSSGFGRFMTPDLLSGHILDPQSLNRYAYVVNDPINLVDPLGLDSGPGQVICTNGLQGCSITVVTSRPFLPPDSAGGGGADTPPPLIFEGGGKKGGGDRKTIPDIKRSIFDQFKKKLNDCLKSIFGKDSTKVPEQSLSNAPMIDARYTEAQLGNMSGNPAGADGWNNPNKGPNGTVYIASDAIFHATGSNAANAIAGTFIHELSNILDEKINPPGTTTKGYGRTYGNPNAQDDTDTGAAVEKCVFGQLQYP